LHGHEVLDETIDDEGAGELDIDRHAAELVCAGLHDHLEGHDLVGERAEGERGRFTGGRRRTWPRVGAAQPQVILDQIRARPAVLPGAPRGSRGCAAGGRKRGQRQDDASRAARRPA
jgi:hypothetical protein